MKRAEEAADEAKRTQLRLNQELLNLRRDYNQTDKEVSIQQKKRELYLNQINLNSEKLGALEDDAESRRLRAIKNAEAIARLSRTNKSLVDAFTKLYDDGSANKSEDNGDGEKSGQPGPTSREKKPPARPTRVSILSNGEREGGVEDEPVIATSNEKLRERLLQVAKEHNRVVKNVELLEIKVEGLRSSVRFADRRNTQLKSELDELRESASLDSSHEEEERAEAARGRESSRDDVNKKLRTLRVPMTPRLSSLLVSSGFDAMEGIHNLDTLLQHVAAAPWSAGEKEVANHLCSRFICHVFKTEKICVYLIQPGGQVMHRYSTGSSEVRVIPLITAAGALPRDASIAEWVVRNRETRCYSRPERHQRFSADVDRPPGVQAVRRLLSVPLCDAHFGAVVGALHFVNKEEQERFSGAEQQYAAAYGELAGALVSTSVKFSRLWTQSERLCALIQTSLQFLDFFEAEAEVSVADVLCALEETVRGTLHCAHAKAFLFSTDADEHGFLTTLDLPPLSLRGARSLGAAPPLRTCPLHPEHPDFRPSVAAYTLTTQRAFLAGTHVSPDHYDYARLCPEGAEYNPAVDLNPVPPAKKKRSSADGTTPVDVAAKSKGCPLFYCVPIITLEQRVIGCIQASPSSLSPPCLAAAAAALTRGPEIHTLTFEDTMGWLSYLLSSKLSNVMSRVGRPLERHGVFLEPLALTQRLSSMEISLAPPDMLAARPCDDLERQILDWNHAHNSLLKNKRDRALAKSGSNSASNSAGNTARTSTTPEKEKSSNTSNSGDFIARSEVRKTAVDDSGDGQLSDKQPASARSDAAPHRAALKEYVVKMRAMHATIEQLRLAARKNRDSFGMQLEKRVHQQVQKEFADELLAQTRRLENKRAEEHSKFTAESEHKIQESQALQAQIREFEEASAQRSKAIADFAQRREQRRKEDRRRGEEEQRLLTQRRRQEAEARSKALAEAEERKRVEEAQQQQAQQAALQAQLDAEAERRRLKSQEVARIKAEKQQESRRRAEEASKLKAEARKATLQKLESDDESRRKLIEKTISTAGSSKSLTSPNKVESKSRKEEVVKKKATDDDNSSIEKSKEEKSVRFKAEDTHVNADDLADHMWQECVDASGRTYYYNALTEESVWEAPKYFQRLHTHSPGDYKGDNTSTNEGNRWSEEVPL